MLWNIFMVLLIAFFVVCFILLMMEDQKMKRNPVPLISNHDKRFGEINNQYSHKIFMCNKGKV